MNKLRNRTYTEGIDQLHEVVNLNITVSHPQPIAADINNNNCITEQILSTVSSPYLEQNKKGLKTTGHSKKNPVHNLKNMVSENILKPEDLLS